MAGKRGPNKRTGYVEALLKKIDCCPFTGMARIAMGDVPCLECDGGGKMGYTMLDDKIVPDINSTQILTCMKCHGTGKEPVPYETRGHQFAQLANYIAPKKRSVEATKTDITRVVIKDYTGAGQEITAEAVKRDESIKQLDFMPGDVMTFEGELEEDEEEQEA